MKKNLNLIIKESITEALLRLMQKKNFYEISITEITKLAGVSRISFYRNFESKEDVLTKYIFECSMTHFDDLSPQTARDKLIALFTVINSISEIIELLYNQHLSHLFLNYFQSVIGAKPEQTNTEAYRNSMGVGICFGALDEWIRRGRQESPEQMVDILQDVMKHFITEPNKISL